MHVKVAIPLQKPIRRGEFMARLDGQRTWVTFKYERLPMFCHWCGLLGHDLKHCVQYFGLTKNGDKVTCQYGDWLKSTGGRPHSSSKESTHTRSTKEDGEAIRQRTSSNEWRATAEDEESRPRNPRLNDSGEKGTSVDSGVIADFVGHNNSDMTITNLKNLNPNLKHIVHANTRTEGDGYIDVKDVNGPHLIKPRPTWTRIKRMDHGLGVKTIEEPVAVLGKKWVFQEVQETKDSAEKQSTKCSKSQNESQCNTTAGCWITLVETNETLKLELPKAWDSLLPSQISEGPGS